MPNSKKGGNININVCSPNITRKAKKLITKTKNKCQQKMANSKVKKLITKTKNKCQQKMANSKVKKLITKTKNKCQQKMAKKLKKNCCKIPGWSIMSGVMTNLAEDMLDCMEEDKK